MPLHLWIFQREKCYLYLIKYAFTSVDISKGEVLFISDQIRLYVSGYFKRRSVIYI